MATLTKPRPQTADELARLIETNDDAAANALLALVRAGEKDALLLDFAAQIVDRKDARAQGTLKAGYGLLSPRQLALWRSRAPKYFSRLAEIAGAKQAPAAPEPPAIGAILDLFARAAEHLQYPKIRLESDGQRVVVSQAGQKSRYPGSLQITDGGPYGESVWFGRITQDGAFTRSRDCTDAIETLIQRFAEQPAEIAAEYGRLTGNCCFCGRHLEDERSTETGYGPICAEKWGLPWGTR